ncbi:MAG TPA: hypothetical protein VKB96_05135 [Gammaproteobacteria bacterium]|nr:hypothetical protein [Gammaproteobacteria bacterium]
MGRYLDIAHATSQDEEIEPPAPSDSAQTVPDSVFADGLRRTVYLARMLAC